MRIGIVGAGYVGLTTASLFAEMGYIVDVIDIDSSKIEKIWHGASPIYEPDLEKILHRNVNKRIFPSKSYQPLKNDDIIFICVGTPSREDGSMDLKYIISASKEISKILGDEYRVIVVKSTVLPGTTENVVLPILEESGKEAGRDFGVCMNPEFLREGNAIYDSFNPDRIVIGEYDKKSGDALESIYKNINAPILRVNIKTAEMIKYASNAFLAMKISFANEVASICEEVKGIDVYKVMRGVGMDHRISPYFLNAGVGFGGSCFPKDVKALIKMAERKNYNPMLLKATMEINDNQPGRFIKSIEKKVGNLKGKKVCVLGLSFKPNTDDIRESRAIIMVEELLKRGAYVIGYDPKAMENFKKKFSDIEYVNSAEEGVSRADICIIQSCWDEFRNFDFDSFSNLKLLADGRRCIGKTKNIPYITVGMRED